MSSKFDALKKTIAKTAEKATSSVAKKAKKLTSVPPHRHCRMCQAAINIKSEPPICNSEECTTEWEREERNRKQLKFWMTAFIALFAFSFIGPLFWRLFAA